MDKENDIMVNLIEKLKEKIGSTKISSQTIHIVLKEAMELVEELNIPGSVKKDNVIKIVKTLVIDLIENEDEEKLILSIIDNNILENTMDLVTADGGFDFSVNFNKQEIMCTKLIYAEIANAIAIQKKGGTLILKIFDIFSKGTVDAIFLLCGLYDSVYITKPKTSRTANSEKYIVCKGFRNINTKYFVDIFHNILKDINKFDNICILNIEFPYIFINKLEDINAILGQIQIENIINTIQLIEYNNNEKIYNIKKQNIQRCLNWCMKYNLSCNSNINKKENIFKKKLNINI